MKSLPSVGFLILFVALGSRGIWESLLGKVPAYGIQMLGIFSGIWLVAYASERRCAEDLPLRSPYRGVMGIWAPLLVACCATLLSVLATEVSGKAAILEYALVVLYPFVLYVTLSTVRLDRIDHREWFNPLATSLWALGLVATAQQIGWEEELPGRTEYLDLIIRPPSLTGSYLHYPLLMALGTLICTQVMIARPTLVRVLLVVPLYGFLAMSFGRSAYFVVVMTTLITALGGLGTTVQAYINGRRLPKATWRSAAALTGVVAFAVLLDAALLDGIVWARVASAGDAEGAGNQGRIQLWLTGIQRWASGPILVGEQFGLVTNVGANIAGADTFVVESSVVQQLLNVGLVGTGAYYWMFGRVWRDMVGVVPWFGRAIFAASLLQTLFYQSIEVVPFISLVMLVPVLSGTVRVMRDQDVGWIGQR